MTDYESQARADTAIRDFFAFRKMITPLIIEILFWIGTIACIVMGLVSIVGGASMSYGGGAMIFVGLSWIVLGPIAVRIYCELLIVIFSINGTLTDVKNLLKEKSTS